MIDLICTMGMAKVKKPRGHNFELHINCDACCTIRLPTCDAIFTVPIIYSYARTLCFLRTRSAMSQASSHKNNSGGH